jgi:hypothetical protein
VNENKERCYVSSKIGNTEYKVVIFGRIYLYWRGTTNVIVIVAVIVVVIVIVIGII